MTHFKRISYSTLFFAVLGAVSACAPHYSDGGRAGTVTKFSHKGWFYKTWEGSMNQGGMKTVTNSDGQESLVPNAFDFHVDDKDKGIIADLEIARDTGRRVTIQYQQWGLRPPTIDSSYVVTAVKFADGKPAASK